MHQLWVPDDVFPVSRPSKPSNDPSYFGTRDNWKLCIAAELYEVVPTAMHGMLKLASTGVEASTILFNIVSYLFYLVSLFDGDATTSHGPYAQELYRAHLRRHRCSQPSVRDQRLTPHVS